MKKIGLMDENTTKLKGGPKVFMSRLKEEMIKNDIYSQEKPDKWLNLSFRKIPKPIVGNKDIEIIVRFDGIWNDSLIPNFRYMPNIKSKLDLLFFRNINKVILENYKLADKVIYQSEFSKYTIEKLLFDRFKVKNENKESIIIYNGVDLNKFKPMSEFKEKESYPNILISHRLIPFKRAHQSVYIVEKLIKYFPNLKVHVVGGGIKNPYYFNKDSKEHFKEAVKKRNLEKHYEFYGHIEPQDLPKVYNKCDFMLNLSYADPCPNVVVEAIACGLPVIAPNTGGIPELVKIKELIVDENISMTDFQPRFIYKDLPMVNADKYVDAILKVMDNLECYSEEMRNLAINNYDISQVAQKYIEFINKN